MAKAVIFDLDNTLYDYDASNRRAKASLAREAAGLLGVGEEEFLSAYARADREVKARMGKSASCHNRMLFCQRAAEMLGGSLVETVPRLYDAYWNAVLDGMELYPGAERFLQALRAEGIRIAICTDMTAHIQYRKLRRLGLAPYVDAIVTSEEMGIEKPHPVMFHACLDKLRTGSGDAVYIGDSLQRDIEGAQRVGIRPVWFVADRPHEERAGILTVESYEDARLWQACGVEMAAEK